MQKQLIVYGVNIVVFGIGLNVLCVAYAIQLLTKLLNVYSITLMRNIL